MGEESEEIKKEIDDARANLSDKVEALQGQLSETVAEAKSSGLKIAGVVAGAILAVLTFKRLRNRD